MNKDRSNALPRAMDSRAWRGERVVARGFSTDGLPELLEDPETIVWVDLPVPDPARLGELAGILNLHPLAVEDAVHRGQRPKLEHYPGHLLLIAYTAHADASSARVGVHEVVAFVTSRALVTVHDHPGFDSAGFLDRLTVPGRLAPTGVETLLYALIDHIVGACSEALDRLEERAEQLAGLVFDAHPRHLAAATRAEFDLRRDLTVARRVLAPFAEVAAELALSSPGDRPLESAPYFREAYDRALFVGDRATALREQLAWLRESIMTVQDNQTTVIAEQVTGWAAILAVPTAVTGFFGQNLPYPGAGQHSGFLASVAVTVVGCVAVYVLFRRRGWL